VTHTFSKF